MDFFDSSSKSHDDDDTDELDELDATATLRRRIWNIISQSLDDPSRYRLYKNNRVVAVFDQDEYSTGTISARHANARLFTHIIQNAGVARSSESNQPLDNNVQQRS